MRRGALTLLVTALASAGAAPAGGAPACVIVGAPGVGVGAHVHDLSSTLGSLGTLPAFGRHDRGGVAVAVGDVSGDAVPDTVLGEQTGGDEVRVLDGAHVGAVVADFSAFGHGFHGGVSVAVGNVEGDGRDDIVVAAGPGGGTQVRVYDGLGHLLDHGRAFAHDDGGLVVAAGDVTGSGADEIVVGSQTSGKVGVFFAHGFRAWDNPWDGHMRQDDFSLAVGDVRGVTHDEVIVGAGPGGVPMVTTFDPTGHRLAETTGLAPEPGERHGVHVATADLDGDGRDEIVTAEGQGGAPVVRVGDEARPVFDPGFHGGVNIAAGCAA